MADLTHVKGLSELQKLLDTLPAKLERNVLRGALRAGMKPIQVEAKNIVQKQSGQLQKGLKIATKAKGRRVMSYLVAKGPHAYIAHWLEFGTRPHTIAPRKGGKELAIGGRYVASAEHPGIRPHPFMRPAMDTQASAALVAVGNYIKNRLATKHGLDTAHIMVEGDE